MSIKPKTIAILSENIAFSSILRMVLAQHIGLRIRLFHSENSLLEYLKISKIDMLILDSDQIDTNVVLTIQHVLNREVAASNEFQIITLCKTLSKGTRALCNSIGIDEVIIKPMSPNYLETRVLVRLEMKSKPISVAKNYQGEERRKSNLNPAIITDNIIPLFGANNNIPPLNQN